MRFITEFTIEGKKWQGVLSAKKTTCKWDLASLIEEKFGWKNPVNGNKGHYKLEIEAFPMDKWVEFKNKLFEYIETIEGISGIRVLEMVKDLEFYSNNKQSIDILLNNEAPK